MRRIAEYSHRRCRILKDKATAIPEFPPGTAEAAAVLFSDVSINPLTFNPSFGTIPPSPIAWSQERTVKKEVSKEELLHMLMRLLRADDLSFLLQLEKEEIERLVAVIRNRIDD
jgi:hypothetical protein